ncbi:caspase-8-like [Watersipora subatra]|uniref:caspase-8-like n=1 Tax=Watersipora subatra TaxID=2589382 RepID=UPI00355C2224
MVEAFINFGQQPQVHCGFTEEKLRSEIAKAIQAEGERISGIVVVLMSHGEEYIVYDENYREIRLQSMLNILCHNDLLNGKPKVLVLQSCLTDRDEQRSTSHNTATNFDVKEASMTLGVGSRSCDGYRFPCGDCCLVTSTSRGKKSQPGFLAETLAKIPRGKSSDETSDIRNIFLEANRKMNKRQIPEIHHNLSKILLLQPPHQRFSMRQKVVNFFRSK